MVNYFACLYEIFPAHLTIHLREKYHKTTANESATTAVLFVGSLSSSDKIVAYGIPNRVSCKRILR